MFRSGLSVFLGFVLMAILVTTYQLIFWMVMPDIFPTPEQIEAKQIPLMPFDVTVLMLMLDMVIGFFGGYFSVAIAGESRIGHAKALAGLVIIMSLLSLSQSLAVETHWYVWFRFFLIPVCVYCGGKLRCKQQPPKMPEATT